MPNNRISPWMLLILCGVAAPMARAQPVGFDPAAPIYNLGADPYGQIGDPGSYLSPPSVPWTRGVHGYVSAGVASQGGADVAAGGMMPLVPGKLDLAVQATTGQLDTRQMGIWAYPGMNGGMARYNAYQATLDWHPTDHFNASLTVAGSNLRLPGPGGPRGFP